MYRFRINTLIVAAGLGLMSLSSCKTLYTQASNKHQEYKIGDQIVADTSIVALYAPYKKQMEAEMNRVIGHSDTHLTKTRDAESLMGNFFVDALLSIGKKLDPETALSFATKGGIRSDMRQGDITIGSVFEIMPFENKISILELTGQDLLHLADFIAQTGGQPVGGMRLVIVDKKPMDILVNGKVIDPKAHYKLVTYDYIANGGDNLKAMTAPIARKDYDAKVREGLIDYISEQTKQGRHIDAKLDGRVKISQ